MAASRGPLGAAVQSSEPASATGGGFAMPQKYEKLALADLELKDTLGTGSFGRVRLCKVITFPTRARN